MTNLYKDVLVLGYGPNAGPVAFTFDNVPKDIQVTIQDSEGTLLQTFRTRNLVIDYSQMGQK